MSEVRGGPARAPIETLKRVKEAEEAADSVLDRARAEGAQLLQRTRDDASRAIAEARAAGEGARETALARARTEADAEAASVLAEGRKAAQKIEMDAAQVVAARRDQVLAVVLGALRPSDGK